MVMEASKVLAGLILETLISANRWQPSSKALIMSFLSFFLSPEHINYPLADVTHSPGLHSNVKQMRFL